MNFLTSYQLADSGGLIISLKNETNTKVKEIKLSAKEIKSDRLTFIMAKLESFLDKDEI